jgi:hypothetical protein
MRLWLLGYVCAMFMSALLDMLKGSDSNKVFPAISLLGLAVSVIVLGYIEYTQ